MSTLNRTQVSMLATINAQLYMVLLRPRDPPQQHIQFPQEGLCIRHQSCQQLTVPVQQGLHGTCIKQELKSHINGSQGEGKEKCQYLMYAMRFLHCSHLFLKPVIIQETQRAQQNEPPLTLHSATERLQGPLETMSVWNLAFKLDKESKTTN